LRSYAERWGKSLEFQLTQAQANMLSEPDTRELPAKIVGYSSHTSAPGSDYVLTVPRFTNTFVVKEIDLDRTAGTQK